MKKLLFIQILLLLSVLSFAQIRYQKNQLSGLFWDYTTNTASESLGKNSVTFQGIQSAWENPAAIAADTNNSSIAFNYIIGHPFELGSTYYFAGIHKDIGTRLSLGLSTHGQVIKDPVWTTQIRNIDFNTDKDMERVFSGIIGFVPLDGLYLGLSGNIIQELGVRDVVTINEFILNFGVNYRRWMNLINNPKFTRQEIRLGFAMTNLTKVGEIIQRFDDSIWQYREMPIIARYGGQYSFELPFRKILKSKCLSSKPSNLKVSVNLQYTDWLNAKSYYRRLGENNSMFSFGIEGLAYKTLAVRLGYYRQASYVEPGRTNATKNRRTGLTTGLGFNFPLHESKGMPFDLQFDLMVQTHPDYLDENISTNYTHPDMKDGKLMMSSGLKIIPR
jgi:hypothetical protein